MMRIGVYLSCEPTGGGSFQYAQFVLDALQALREEYDVIPIFTTRLWEEILQRDYDFREIHFIQLQYDHFAQCMDSFCCDLILVTDQGDLAEWIETPVVSIIHDLMHRYETAFPEVSADGEYERRECYMKNICEYSAGVLVDSEIGKQQVLESYGKFFADKVYVQPFRVPNYLYDAREKASNVATDGKDEKYLFYPAQFWTHKNHQNLFLAIRQLLDEGIDVKLVCVGSEKNGSVPAKQLIQRLSLENNVTCLGYVSDEKICELYQHARAMVMPTFFGPTNIPPLEAMFMGCPLAVSDIYAMPEQVGDAALLFDPKSVDSIAEAIRCLWEDDALCKQLSMNGRKRSELFSREKYNECFAKNLKEIIRKLHDTSDWSDRFLSKCRSKHLYLYGAGRYSYMTAAFLLMHHVDIEGFLVTSEKGNPSEFLGRPVMACDALELPEGEEPFVLVALTKRYHEEVLKNLDRLHILQRGVLQGDDIKNIMKAFTAPQGQNFIRRLRVKGCIG